MVMARKDWSYCPIDRDLVKQIDRLMKVAKKDNGTKYDSRAEFVAEAISEKIKIMEVVA